MPPKPLRWNALLAMMCPLSRDWRVVRIEDDEVTGAVVLSAERTGEAPLNCAECGSPGTVHDHLVRSWRHLDLGNRRSILEARVPRVRCAEHGVHQIDVPWARRSSRFTLSFEEVAARWLHKSSVAAVAEGLGISWDEAVGIRDRYAIPKPGRKRVDRTPEAEGDGEDPAPFDERSVC